MPAAVARIDPLILGLFLVSGATGLIYQVLWVRILTLTLSVTVYAVATVLSAFMAGLGLGAFVGGRLADRLRRPLMAYGIAELGVALTALVTPLVLFHLGPVYRVLYDTFGGSGVAFGAARFLLAASVLLVPCTLMGTTLPLLSRAVIADARHAGRGAGALYATNTFGAVLGCVLAGFVLIPTLGLSTTNALAVAVSATVGAVAVTAGRHTAQVVHPATPVARIPWTRTGLIAAAVWTVSGFTALGYEVMWTRALEQYTHNSVYAYSAMLATFLAGIAGGSALAARVVPRLEQPMALLGAIEIGIGLAVGAALLVYARLDQIAPAIASAMGGLHTWSRVIALIFAQVALVMLPMTLLFGATFPVATRAVVEQLDSAGRRIGQLYAANTVGSILGSVAVSFLLLPWLGLRGTFVALAAVNVALGIGLLLVLSGSVRRWGLVLGTAAIVALALVPAGLFEESYARRFGKLLFYREQVTDTVMVTEDARGERMIRYGDGRGTAGTMTAPEDRIYAHIPLLLHPDPRRVLTICFGVGNSLAAATLHPIERVDAVELSPGVVDAAPFFTRTNRAVLHDPRVALTIADGRNFLLATRETYDIVRLDPPELHTAGIVNLYTREFYELARARLRPGGIFSIWVNIVMTPEEDLRHLVRTVAAVFPHVSIWDGPFRYSWVINGSMTPHPPDLARLERRYADGTLRADLASARAPDPYALLARFVMGDAAARAFAGSGPLVTDDHTMLDFTVPRSLDSFFGFTNANTGGWLTQLMAPDTPIDVGAYVFLRKIAHMGRYREPVLPFVTGIAAAGTDPATVAARIEAAQRDGQAPARGGAGTSPAQAS